MLHKVQTLRICTKHEVEFILQRENTIMLMENKSEENIRAASIKFYEKEYPESTPIVVHLSLRKLSFYGKMLNVPLFMVD